MKKYLRKNFTRLTVSFFWLILILLFLAYIISKPINAGENEPKM